MFTTKVTPSTCSKCALLNSQGWPLTREQVTGFFLGNTTILPYPEPLSNQMRLFFLSRRIENSIISLWRMRAEIRFLLLVPFYYAKTIPFTDWKVITNRPIDKKLPTFLILFPGLWGKEKEKKQWRAYGRHFWNWPMQLDLSLKPIGFEISERS